MKILFLTHYFPPEVNAPASRTFEHCREWVRQGCEVTVLTCAPNHPQGKLYPGYRNRLYQVESLRGISVTRVWTLLAANEGLVMRTLNYLSYMISSILAARFRSRPDIVISTSPQFFCGLAGYFVSRLLRRPWIVEIRDLWPDSILAVGAIRNRLLIRALKFLECFIYRKSDHIVVLTEAFRRHITALGIPSEKIDVIKNGVDLDFFAPTTPEVDYKRSLGLGPAESFVIAYVGTLGMAHHLETALEAAAKLTAYPQIFFLLVGDGAERERLLALRERMGLKNVIIPGQQPKQLMPKIWGITDLCLIHLKKSELFTTVIPSKLFEGMAMGKPVLLGVDGESREILEEAKAGLHFEPENPQQLADAVLHFYNDPRLLRSTGTHARRYAETVCSRAVLARRYLDLIERCASEKGLGEAVTEDL